MNNGKISLAMRNPLDKQNVESDAMVLSQGRLAKLGQLLGSSVSTTRGGMPEFNEEGELILADPNDPNQPQRRISTGVTAESQRLESFFGGTRRSPQWQITVIRGKDVKEEILEMAESDSANQ